MKPNLVGSAAQMWVLALYPRVRLRKMLNAFYTFIKGVCAASVLASTTV
jgi:hypothetical protein